MKRTARRRAPENVAKKTAAPVMPITGPVSARDFFLSKMGGTMTDAHRATGIGYATLRGHVRYNKPIKHVDIAKKLEEWSHGVISAAKTLGV